MDSLNVHGAGELLELGTKWDILLKVGQYLERVDELLAILDRRDQLEDRVLPGRMVARAGQVGQRGDLLVGEVFQVVDPDAAECLSSLNKDLFDPPAMLERSSLEQDVQVIEVAGCFHLAVEVVGELSC